jgi:beta-lactam-binding protein with PASTA domain
MSAVVVVSAITSAVVCGAIMLGVHAGGTLFDTEPRPVPDLSGMTLESAATALSGARLTLVVAGEEHHETFEAGRICRQEPRVGSQVPPDTSIQVWSSLGPEPARVPAVIGMAVEAARAAIEDAGLRVGTVTEEEGDGTPGAVVRSSPGSSEAVARGSSVDLVARPAVVLVEVPDLVGESSRTAREMIVAAGLVVGDVRVRFDDIRAPYVVLSQDPEAGARVPAGSTIHFVQNEGD